MRRTGIVAVLAVLVVMAAFAAHASAMYHPGTARFVQRDPAGYVDDTNLYQFVSSSPGLFLDPLGLRSSPEMQEQTVRQIALATQIDPIGNARIAREENERMEAIRAPGFKVCHRDIAKPGLLEDIINTFGPGAHTFLAYGDVSESARPARGKEETRWGVGIGNQKKGTLPNKETTFEVRWCKPCTIKTECCLPDGKWTKDASQEDIMTCLSAHPMSKDYNDIPGYYGMGLYETGA